MGGNELEPTRIVTISTRTVRKRLNETQLESMRPVTAFLITREQS